MESEPVGDAVTNRTERGDVMVVRTLRGHHPRSKIKIQVDRRLTHQYPSTPVMHDA
jgi:hypothetical protein